jgi:hypothetical protein
MFGILISLPDFFEIWGERGSVDCNVLNLNDVYVEKKIFELLGTAYPVM